MDKNTMELRSKIYDLEMAFEEISMLTDIILNFGEYNAEVPDGAEKMYILTKILSEKNIRYKKLLTEFIPEFQQIIKE